MGLLLVTGASYNSWKSISPLISARVCDLVHCDILFNMSTTTSTISTTSTTSTDNLAPVVDIVEIDNEQFGMMSRGDKNKSLIPRWTSERSGARAIGKSSLSGVFPDDIEPFLYFDEAGGKRKIVVAWYWVKDKVTGKHLGLYYGATIWNHGGKNSFNRVEHRRTAIERLVYEPVVVVPTKPDPVDSVAWR